MRISDWSSYVCSSDLRRRDSPPLDPAPGLRRRLHRTRFADADAPRCAPGLRCFDAGTVGPAAQRRLRGGARRAAADRRRAGSDDPAPRRDDSLVEIGRAPSELQSLMRSSYADFCLKKKKTVKLTPRDAA